MSRGRSITIDCRRRGEQSGVAVARHELDDRRALLGRGRLPGRDESNAKITAAICMVRISGTFAMMVPSLYRLFRCCRADAEPNDIDVVAALPYCLSSSLAPSKSTMLRSDIVSTAHQLGAGEHFGLMRRELERRGLPITTRWPFLSDGLIDSPGPGCWGG